MGTKQSVYEKPGSLDYYKFSAEEYALVKKVWSDIEINPQFHGNACLKSFCKTHPQYIKFFTQDSKLYLNFDTCVTNKFSIIMETIGYLLLDFNKKPKQLDRLVGYIAMIHKDMPLDEQDMRNFVTSLFEYLSQTYPTEMTTQCQGAMSKFMDSIIRELFIKIKTFRDYEAQLGTSQATQSKSPWGRCPLFAEPPIFGKTKLHWDEWKKQWNARLAEWKVQATPDSAQEEPISAEPISFTNDMSVSSAKINLDDEEEIVGILQRRPSALIRKLHEQDESDSNLSLLSLSKMNIVERSPNPARRWADNKELNQQHVEVCFPNEHPESASDSRERHRPRNFTRKASKAQNDATIVSVTMDCPALDKITSEDQGNKESVEQQECELSEIAAVKPQNTARERRRERFSMSI